ncbi:hypothetical protein SFRURICE_019736 [Spodoptera frugiperda]|nr:hypothetical protein SFRURICE_019736 [Spodoptera frugiperda]
MAILHYLVLKYCQGKVNHKLYESVSMKEIVLVMVLSYSEKPFCVWKVCIVRDEKKVKTILFFGSNNIFCFISLRDQRQSLMSLERAGFQCSGVIMLVSTVDPGLQELQRFWEVVAGLSHLK